MMKGDLDRLAAHYNGSIQFAYVDANAEEAENLRITYWAYATPRTYYIDPATRTAYLFELGMTKFNKTVEWIDEQ